MLPLSRTSHCPDVKSATVIAAKHVILVKEPLTFTLTWGSGSIEHTFESGKEISFGIRKSLGGVVPMAGQVSVTVDTSVHFAKEMYLERKL